VKNPRASSSLLSPPSSLLAATFITHSHRRLSASVDNVSAKCLNSVKGVEKRGKEKKRKKKKKERKKGKEKKMERKEGREEKEKINFKLAP